MIYLVAALLLAAVLFWLGLVRSHWVAPAVLFAESAPVVAALSWTQGFEQIAIYLVVNLALFYAAFALGRMAADRYGDRFRAALPSLAERSA